MLRPTQETNSVLSELSKEDLIRLLEEKDRIIKGFTSKVMDPSVKEVWEAITRLRDRIDNLEQLIARVSATSSESVGHIYGHIDDLYELYGHHRNPEPKEDSDNEL